MQIFLVGYMGVGKSSLGKKLAAKLKRPFMDLDALVVADSETSISAIFETKGEAYFRALEAKVLRTSSSGEPAVIATGGGAPMHHGNMDYMLRTGLVIWLKMDDGIIFSRLTQKAKDRPLINDKTPDELHSYIKSHLAERAPTYALAPIHVVVPLANAEAIDTVVRTIRRYSK